MKTTQWCSTLALSLAVAGCSREAPEADGVMRQAMSPKAQSAEMAMPAAPAVEEVSGGGGRGGAMRAKKITARAPSGAVANLLDADLAPELAPPPPPAEDSAKDGAVGAEPVLTRAWFPETFLFAPKVLTDAEGRGSLAVRVPDRLTTWRVLALAHARNGAQAGTVASFVSQLPVSVDVVTPPFLVAGDRVALPIQLQNMTDARQERTLKVSASGGRLEGTGGPMSVPEQGSQTTTLWLATKTPGTIAIEARIDDDAMVKSVDVLASGQPRHTEQAGTLAAPRTITLDTADPDGAPIPGSGRIVARVFPGALSVLRAELQAAPARTTVADDGALVTLSAVAPTLAARLGTPVDDAALLKLRRLAAQRLARVALSPSLESATALAGGAARHDHDGLLGRTGEHLAAYLARQQRPDGTFGGGSGVDVQRLLVGTADAVFALQQAALPLTPSSSTAAEASTQRATAATLKARGAFERMLAQADDPYTAAAIVMTGAVDGEARAALQQKILAALVKGADGSRSLPVPDDVHRGDGGRPSVVEASARALLALADHKDAADARVDLGAFILQGYRPGRGFGDGVTNRLVLLALGEVFAEPMPQKVSVTLSVDGTVVATEQLEGDKLKDMVATSVPVPGLGPSVKVELRSDPPLPGLVFVVGADWNVPFSPPPPDAGLTLERTLPDGLRVGTPATLSLAAVAPGGAPITVTVGLPAGVDVVTRSLERLQQDGVITRFEVVEGTMTLEAPGRAQGERFAAKVQVVPTLAGTLKERVASVAVSGQTIFLPPATWNISR